MTIRHLKIFASVCEEKTMSGTAKKLYMTQPAVSQAIKELEENYQVQLFQRFPTCLYITEEGELLYQYSKQILALLDETEKSIGRPDELPTLKIGVNITVGDTMITEFLKLFSEKNPNQKVSVVIQNGSKLKELLHSNQLDFALMEEGKKETHFITEEFYQDRIAFVVSPSHKLSKVKKIDFHDFTGESFLLREKGAGVREIFDSIVAIKGIQVQTTWESCSSQAILQGVQAGFGIGVLPYRLVREQIKNQTLTELEVADLNLNRKLQIVYHKNKWLSKAAKDFIHIVKTISVKENEA